MRKLDWLLLIVLIVGAIGGKFLDFGDAVPPSDNPRRPSPENFTPKLWDSETRAWLSEGPTRSGTELPFMAELPREGIIDDGGKPASSVGSAFAVAKRGIWLTARHVVDGCDQTWLRIGEKRGLKIQRVFIHPNADVAVLITNGGPEGLALAATNVRLGESYSVGFPKGAPGAVHARYVGEMTLRHRGGRGGRQGYRERVSAWSERSRIPSRQGSLGGLSGGVVLGDSGRVVGVVQAESRRRGRIMTARPETLYDAFRRANVSVPALSGAVTGAEHLTAKDYPRAARRLITTIRVAKVLCRVG